MNIRQSHFHFFSKITLSAYILASFSDAFSAGFTTTSIEDTTPPVISELSLSSIQSHKATVSWTTDEVSDSNIKFNATGSSDEKFSGNLSFTIDHHIILTRLNPNTDYSITVTSTDPSGNSSSATISFSTSDQTNNVPTISGSPSASVSANASYNFTPNASDSDGDSLNFSIQNKPIWAQFNTSTGQLSGTPNTNHIGSYLNIIISVSDGSSQTSLTSFSINVGEATGGDSGNNENENQDGLIISTFTDSNGKVYTNIINTNSNSTSSTNSNNTTYSSSFGNINQEIILFNDGKISSRLETLNDKGESVEITIDSSFVGTETSLEEDGSITFEATISDKINVAAELKEDGSVLQTTTYSAPNKPVKISTISTNYANSSLRIDEAGETTLIIIFDTPVKNSSGKVVNVQNNTVIKTTDDGSIVISSNQKDSDNPSSQSLINVIESQTFSPGASIDVSEDKITITNVTDKEIKF